MFLFVYLTTWLIYRTFAFKILSGVTRQEKRTQDYHKFIQAREERKNVRRAYWKDLIRIEIATILSIAWFIQMELIRTGQVPSVWTLTQMQKVPLFQQGLIKQASTVYNNVYRDRESSQFILTDTGIDQLDGRIGYIDSYNEVWVGYHSLLCERGSSNRNKSTSLFVKTEHMSAVKSFLPRKYNKEAKKKEFSVGVHNLLPHTDGGVFEVKFCHDIFSHICKVHQTPERNSNVAYATMTKMMEEKEGKEREQAARCEQHQAVYKEAMNTFYSTHEPVSTSPHKRLRTSLNRTDDNHELQVQSVWKAKFEHMQAIMNGKNASGSEHLFTYPFLTTDNSLIQCLDGLAQLGQHHSAQEEDHVLNSSTLKHKPAVITSKSLISLSPGVDINEDIMDLCLKW